MSETKNDKKSIFKTWLETLQQESWQLELLISGLALFGVFEAKALIDSLESFLSLQYFRGSALLAKEVLLFLLRGSWYIFLINLMIHIVLRGLWIGAIGLRYVSEDIDYKSFNFSTYFEKLYTKRYQSFDDYIEELERICSVIFAYTFLLFFILISACLFLIWPIVILSFLGDQRGGFLVLAYLVFGLIVFTDFILLNPLKKIKDGWFSRWYGFIFRLYSTLTLSFVFRPLLLNFLDNKFTRRLFLFSIPYGIVIILLVPNIITQSTAYFPDLKESSFRARAFSSEAINPLYYDDLDQESDEAIRNISLRNYRNDNNIFEFFIRYLRNDENFLKNELQIASLNKVGVYSGWRSIAAIDSSYEKIKQENVSEKVEFVKNRMNDPDLHSETRWDSLYIALQDNHNEEERLMLKKKAKVLNESIIKLCRFYIDDVDVSDEVTCLISEHMHQGEKGWRCFVPMDSLENGVHYFKVERGLYQSKLKTNSTRVYEIPFILDRS